MQGLVDIRVILDIVVLVLGQRFQIPDEGIHTVEAVKLEDQRLGGHIPIGALRAIEIGAMRFEKSFLRRKDSRQVPVRNIYERIRLIHLAAFVGADDLELDRFAVQKRVVKVAYAQKIFLSRILNARMFTDMCL